MIFSHNLHNKVKKKGVIIMAKAEYKSAIRSRKLIRTAFVELMQEKDTDKITVTDIVKRADINRGTFYAHYSDTHAVLEQIENEFLQHILEILDDSNYETFIQNPYPVFQSHIIKSFPIKESEKSNPSFLAAIHFYAGGIVITYYDWFDDNLKMSLTELTQMISSFIKKGCDMYLHS